MPGEESVWNRTKPWKSWGKVRLRLWIYYLRVTSFLCIDCSYLFMENRNQIMELEKKNLKICFKEINTFLNEVPTCTSPSILEVYLYCITYSTVNRQVINTNNGSFYKFVFCNFVALYEGRKKSMIHEYWGLIAHLHWTENSGFFTWLQLFLSCILPPSKIKHRREMVRMSQAKLKHRNALCVCSLWLDNQHYAVFLIKTVFYL